MSTESSNDQKEENVWMPLDVVDCRKYNRILERAEKNCYRYGIDTNDAKCEKPCKRIRRDFKWSRNPIKNTSGKHPAKLKVYHLSWMMENNRQLPDYSESELRICHRCVEPNRKNTNRRSVGATCFEATHLDLKTRQWNKEQEKCHKVIDDYVRHYEHDPNHKTTGIIYVVDVPRECRQSKFRELVCRHNCFGNYGKITTKKKK